MAWRRPRVRAPSAPFRSRAAHSYERPAVHLRWASAAAASRRGSHRYIPPLTSTPASSAPTTKKKKMAITYFVRMVAKQGQAEAVQELLLSNPRRIETGESANLAFG